MQLGKEVFYIPEDDEELRAACVTAQEAKLAGIKVDITPPKYTMGIEFRVDGVGPQGQRSCFNVESVGAGWKVECSLGKKVYKSWGWVERAFNRWVDDPVKFEESFYRKYPNWRDEVQDVG